MFQNVPDVLFYPKALYFLNFTANPRITCGPTPHPLDPNLCEMSLGNSSINMCLWVILSGSLGNIAVAGGA